MAHNLRYKISYNEYKVGYQVFAPRQAFQPSQAAIDFMRFGRAIGKSELQKETSLKPLLLPDMALRVPCHAIWAYK